MNYLGFLLSKYPIGYKFKKRMVASEHYDGTDFNLYYVEIINIDEPENTQINFESYILEKSTSIDEAFYLNICDGEFSKLTKKNEFEVDCSESASVGWVSDIGIPARAGNLSDIVENFLGGWQNFEFPSEAYLDTYSKERPKNFRYLHTVYEGLELLYPKVQYEVEELGEAMIMAAGIIDEMNLKYEPSNKEPITESSAILEKIWDFGINEFVYIQLFEVFDGHLIDGLNFKLYKFGHPTMASHGYVLLINDKEFVVDFINKRSYYFFTNKEGHTIYENKHTPDFEDLKQIFEKLEEAIKTLGIEDLVPINDLRTEDHNKLVMLVLSIYYRLETHVILPFGYEYTLYEYLAKQNGLYVGVNNG